MPITPTNPFKGRQYPGEVILLAVRWYLRYPLAYLHVSEILAERGLFVDASCIWRWVQAYAPELDKRCRPHLKTDEQELPRRRDLYKGQGQRPVPVPCRGLHRPDDRFSADGKARCRRREALLPQRLFSAPGNPMPRVVNVDKNPAYPAAVEALKAEGTLPRRVRLRQCKYLNNIVEQDHRTVKKRVWLAKGYGSFQSAWRTLQGIETMHMINKGRVRWLAKGDAVGQAHFVASLFGIAA